MNTNYSENKFFTSIIHFFSGTMISRIFGLLREILMAVIWGAEPLIAVFWIAFRLIFFLRRIFGETALSMVFIPHFEMLRVKGNGIAKVFFKKTVKFFTISSICVLLAIELFCFFWMKLSHNKDHSALVLIMFLSPSSVFLVLHALNVSLLHCERKFFLASLSPAIVNFFWVVLLFFSSRFSCYLFLKWLSIFLVLGFFFQWLITVPDTLSFLKNQKYLENNNFYDEKQTSCWHVLKPMLFAILGTAITQVNSLVDMFIARFIDPIGPSFLWYANRIYQLPMGVIVISFFSVLLPLLSKSIKENDENSTKNIFIFSFSTIFLLMTVIMLAMILLSFSGINLVYGHGLFSLNAVKSTVFVLWGYAFGLIPSAINSITSVLFYAKKEYFIPTILGIVSIILNCCLSFLLTTFFSFKIFGISLATSICSWTQCMLLWLFASREHVFLRGLFTSVFFKLRKDFFVSLITFLFSYFLSKFLLHKTLFFFFTSSILKKAFYFGFEASIFLVFLWLFAKIFGSEELRNCFSMSFWKNRYYSSDLK